MQDSLGQLTRKFRKKVFITSALGIISSLLCLGLSFIPIISSAIQPVEGLIRGLTLIMILYFWARNIDLAELLSIRGNAIIKEWEERLRPKSWKEMSLLQKGVFGLISANILISLFANRDTSEWPAVILIGFALFAFLFFFFRWLKLQEAFMLQDLKHSLRNDHIEPS